MNVHQLALELNRVRGTSSRKLKIQILKELLCTVDGSQRSLLVFYLCGELPTGKIGVGPSLLSQIRKGPPEPQSSCSLNLLSLEKRLSKIQSISGKGSKSQRRQELESLLASTSSVGQDFLFRLLSGGLRQGALAGVVEQAVAGSSSVELACLRRAVMLLGSLPEACRVAFDRGELGLKSVKLSVMRALSPMLASPVGDVDEARSIHSEALWEHKLDGVRVQVHREGEKVRIFSRNMREMSSSMPEVVEHALSLNAETFVLDGEVLSFAPNGFSRPFQETMRRFGRRQASLELKKALPLSPRYFDILLLDGRELWERPLRERRRELEILVGKEELVEARVLSGASECLGFFHDIVRGGLEGAMVKDLGSVYCAGKRGTDWLKLKPYQTLDLVVLAAEWGSGRRKGLLSNLHLGAYCDQANTFLPVGKTFKGLTDELLTWQTQEFLRREVSRGEGVVRIEPALVVEIAFNEIQASARYASGLALRFARVKRYRNDLSLEDADSLKELRTIFQHSRQSDSSKGDL